MQVTVFGGTGRTGRLVVEQALAQGHTVKVLARNPDKLTIRNPMLTIVQGALTDAAAVEQAVAGSDAVISALGPANNKPTYEISQAMQLIVGAMRQAGVRRLVIAAGAGVGAPGDQPGMMDKMIVGLLKTFNGNVYEDMRRSVETVQNSGLEWTVIRAPMLTDDPAKGSVRQGAVGKDIGTRLSRADFAATLLRAAGDPTLVGAMPAISN